MQADNIRIGSEQSRKDYMVNVLKTLSGASAVSKEAIYELRFISSWPGPWRGCRIGELGGLIRKHKPRMIVRIR
jgi:hypothetical protein